MVTSTITPTSLEIPTVITSMTSTLNGSSILMSNGISHDNCHNYNNNCIEVDIGNKHIDNITINGSVNNIKNNTNNVALKSTAPNSLIGKNLEPPDGGWGWVVVAASFYCCAIVDGLASVVGVLLPQLVNHFIEASHSHVALAGSLYAGMFLLTGIVASICIDHFGCRTTTIAGAIISTTSILLSTMATNIYIFILMFGIVGGFGIGLVYSPASVMVNYYFFRRRGLANGIACAGAGAGILILSPLTEFLADLYGWKGCLWIIAGFSLQCTICGALMRPLKVELIQNRDALSDKIGILDEERDDDDNLEFKCQDGIGYCMNEPIDSPDNLAIKNETFDSIKTSNEVFPKLDVIIEKEELKLKQNVLKDFFNKDSNDIKARNMNEDIRKQRKKKLFQKQKGNAASLSNSELTTWMTIPESSILPSSASSFLPPQPPPSLLRTSMYPPIRRNRGVSESFTTTDYSFVQFLNRKQDDTTASQLMKSDSRMVISTIVLNPLNRVDAFYPGSMSSLHRVLGSSRNVDTSNKDITQQPILTTYSKDGISTVINNTSLQQLQHQTTASTLRNNSIDAINFNPSSLSIQEIKEAPAKNACLSKFSRFFNIRLFTNPSFLIISVSCVFIQLAFFVPILFLADYVQKLGFNPNQGALLLSLLGGSNMIGRALGGALASVSYINILHLNCLSLIIAGTLTGLLSVFVNFESLLFYVLAFGLFVAFFIPLTPMFLVKYLGLENLTNSFGMLCMIKGIATMTGPPIAGYFYQTYGSYNKTFYFGGAMFVLAGFSFYSLALVSRSLKTLAKECLCIVRNDVG